MDPSLLSLKWNNHKRTFFKNISKFRTKSLYTDVTLACDSQYFQVHKIVLSSCSEYFEELFNNTHCKCPIIVLKDIRPVDIEALLNYMYIGEVEVKQDDLPHLIKAAECLKIKGLAFSDEDEGEQSLSPSKKKRKEIEQEQSEVPKKINKSETASQDSENISDIKNVPVQKDEVVKLEPIDSDFGILELCDNEKEEQFDEKYTEESHLTPEDLLQYDENYFCDDSIMPDINETPRSSSSQDVSTSENMDSSGQQERLFIEHSMDSAGRKILQCAKCEYKTAHKSHMNQHQVCHTGKKDYQCDFCDLRVSTRSSLNRHLKIHSGDKPFHCPDCDFKSAHRWSWKNHMFTSHKRSE